MNGLVTLTERTCFAVSRGSVEALYPKTVFPRKRKCGIISISSSGRPQADLQEGWDWVHRQVYDDVDGYQNGYIPFTETMANDLFRELDKEIRTLDYLIVHCDAGLSRSPATVVAILEGYVQNKTVWKRYPTHNKFVYRKLTEAFYRGKN